jgi:hypothetical protein
MDYESVPNVGAQLGSASVIVIDDSVSIPWLINKTVHFFRHESCGKCTPCREGTFWMSHLTERIAHNHAKPEDVELLYEVANQIRGKSLCALGEFSIEAVASGSNASVAISTSLNRKLRAVRRSCRQTACKSELLKDRWRATGRMRRNKYGKELH